MTSRPQPELRELFIDGMSKAACTVNIVTTDGAAGRAGLTVSAMCSVSADPTSLLVCVHEQSRACEVIRGNGAFCVNVLHEEQSHISDTFAGRHSIDDKFSCAEWATLETSAPALNGALASFDCELKKNFKWGSHYILIGEVKDIGSRASGHPLIYANRAYGRAIAMDPISLKASSTPATGHNVRIGSYLNVAAFFMPGVLAAFRNQQPEVSVEVTEGSHSELIEKLESGELDSAVMYLQEDIEGFHIEPLAELDPYILLPSEHPLASAPELSLSDLQDYPLVSLKSPSGGSSYIDSLFKRASLEPSRGPSAASFEMLRGLVAHGLGYSITVTKPASNMSYDGVAIRRKPIKDTLPPARLYLVHSDKVVQETEHKHFVDFLRSHFREIQ